MAHNHPESSTFRSLTRYEDYYLPGGDLFLLVEHHVFRVHRYFFERESTYFKGKLATPASPGSTRPGTNESNAILLDDVRVHEFARFLWVFYNPKYSLYNASVADWVAILTLAHRWVFPEVKALAIRELEKQTMPDIERVVFYQDNGVDRNLLIPCYAALVERDEPLSFEEGRRMGIETALTVARLREMARRSPLDCRSPTPPNFHGHELLLLVRELFDIALPPSDDSVPQTPLGGPTPFRWLPSPQTTVTPSAVPPLPEKATVPPLPPRTSTPPLPAAQTTELLTPPQESTSQPPPPPEKPERPHIVTGPKQPLKKVKVTADPSRPSTPATETSTTETSTTEKKTKRKQRAKKQQETVVTAEAACSAAQGDEKANATEVTEDATQHMKDEGKKDEGEVVIEPEKKDTETGAEEKQDEATVLQENKEAGPSVTPETVSPDLVEKKQAGTEAGGNGVSTDTNNPPVDPAQIPITRSDSRGSTASYKPLDIPFSPVGKPKSPLLSRDDFKSPQERVKSPSVTGSVWGQILGSF